MKNTFTLIMFIATITSTVFGNMPSYSNYRLLNVVNIVNADGEKIKESKIWYFNDYGDSFQVNKSLLYAKRSYNIAPEKVDSASYYFTKYTGWCCMMGFGFPVIDEREKKTPPYFWRIQAKGYADIIIKDKIIWAEQKDSQYNVLNIVMGTAILKKTGTQTHLLNQFIYTDTLQVNGIRTVGQESLVDNMRKNALFNKYKSGSIASIKTFPNPVIQKLSVEISDPASLPGTIKLLSNSGSVLKETSVNETKTSLDVEWLPKASYIFQVYDSKKMLIFSQIIIKRSEI